MKTADLIQKINDKSSQAAKAKYMGPIKYMNTDIAQYYNPTLVINDIINENQTKNFTSILLIGTPGTGKTTLATFLAHSIHTQTNFKVKWFGKEDIRNLDNVLKDLPAEDYILIFDDVSMAIKRIKDPQKRLDVLEALTTIRHPASGADRNIITIANIHYMFALEKIWRDQGSWKIFTDLQGEELQNFNNYTRFNFSRKAETFSGIALDQFRKKTFWLKTSNNSEKKPYTTNKPFRFVMVHDGVKLRFMLVPRLGCSECSGESYVKKPKIHAAPLVDVLAAKYGKDGTLALKFLAWTKGQNEQVRKPLKYALDDVIKMDGLYDIDWPKVAISLREKSGIVRKRDWRKQGDQEELIARIFEESKKV